MSYFPEHQTSWHRIDALIRQASRVFLTTHVNPDGDAIGCIMAFAGVLKGMGKPHRVIIQSKLPELYTFLDPEGIIESLDAGASDTEGPGKDDLVVFVDMGEYGRAGTAADLLLGTPAKVVVIDHHVSESIEADIAVVEPSAAATGCLLFDLFYQMGPSLITQPVAEALMTAIVTDTSYFSYSNTLARTYRIAAELHDRGGIARNIRRRMEITQPLNRQKLLGLALARVKVSDCGRIAWSSITLDMFREAGAEREHTEGIINQIRIIRGISVAALIIQESGREYKISFRSMSGVPVNLIAGRLGGGGHMKAAGATVYGTLEEVTARMLAAVTRAIEAFPPHDTIPDDPGLII